MMLTRQVIAPSLREQVAGLRKIEAYLEGSGEEYQITVPVGYVDPATLSISGVPVEVVYVTNGYDLWSALGPTVHHNLAMERAADLLVNWRES